MYRLLHTASALSSSSPTTAASSSSPPPPRPPPPHRPRVLLVPITRHCLADLLSQRHHQSHGGRRPRVPFAGSTVVVRSADGVNSATVVQCSIPNACRAVLSTAVPSLSDPPPPPQCRLCRPVCQHLRTLRRLIFLRHHATTRACKEVHPVVVAQTGPRGAPPTACAKPRCGESVRPPPAATPSSAPCQWRPPAQRNLRNQWSRLLAAKARWLSAAADGLGDQPVRCEG
uniref:Uncharacterized protein n=1 Tax=Oryza meridionalis TaxID=40149 RepID=A0A0E0C2U0_9ORYZ